MLEKRTEQNFARTKILPGENRYFKGQIYEPVSKLYKNKIPLMIFVFSVFSRYLPL